MNYENRIRCIAIGLGVLLLLNVAAVPLAALGRIVGAAVTIVKTVSVFFALVCIAGGLGLIKRG